MNDIQLECFCSLAKTLSFSTTAKELFISQQAVSKNIAKLENVLGFPLFYRTSHNVELTKWGNEFYRIYSEFCEKHTYIRTDYQANNNSFRILTLNQPEYEPVINLRPFKIPDTNYYAKVDIDFITPASNIVEYLNQKADMIVINERFISSFSNISSEPVYETYVSFLVSRRHPLLTDSPVFEDFRKEPLLAGVPGLDIFETRESLKRDILKFNLEPASIILLNSCKDALAAVARGDGVVLGNILDTSSYRDSICSVPSNTIDRIVCIWNTKHSKMYTKDLVAHIKKEYQNHINP